MSVRSSSGSKVRVVRFDLDERVLDIINSLE
jgi:hypothetical protein